MTERNDLGPDDDGAQFFRRGGGGPGAPCPSPELVQAARMSTLPPHVQDRVAAHVERCVVCQALGDALNDPSVGELRPDEQARILERVHAGANVSTRIRSANRLWQFAGCRRCRRGADCWHRARLAVPSRGASSVNSAGRGEGSQTCRALGLSA